MPPKSAKSKSAPTNSKLATAYNEAIISGHFIDTVLYAYSCKTSSGIGCKPRPIYANSFLLKHHAAYFEPLFSSFTENRLSDIDGGFPPDKPSIIRDYDYDCDSDLESIADEEIADEIARWDETRHDDASSPESQPSSKEESPAGVVTTSCDNSTVIPDNSQSSSAVEHAWRRDGPHCGAVRLGRVIVISNIAYTTLRAIVSNMVCDDPVFLPLKSTSASRTMSEIPNYHAFACSPKSAYRAADMLQLSRLKTSALQAVKSRLTPNNILQELFSPFTSLYDEVTKMQIEYLFQIAPDQSQHIIEALPTWTTKLCGGEIPYSSLLLSKLIVRGLPKSNSVEYGKTAELTCGTSSGWD